MKKAKNGKVSARILRAMTAVFLCAAMLATSLPVSVSAAGLQTLEGWQVSYTDPSKAFISQPNGKGPLHVNAEAGSQAFIALNGSGSDKSLQALFGKDSMDHYTVEYSVRAENLAQLGWSVIAYNDTNFNVESVQVMHNNSWSVLDYEFPAGGVGGLAPGFTSLCKRIVTGSQQQVVLTKSGAEINYNSFGDNAYGGATSFSATIPADIGSTAASNDMTASGYVGFYINVMKGMIYNVKVTNNTTGMSKTFFTEEYEGWQISYTNPQNGGFIKQKDGRGPLYITSSGSQAFLALNGENSSPELKAMFGKDNMTSYTVEYDVTCADLVQLAWSVIAYNDTNFNVESVQLMHNQSWTLFGFEYPAGGISTATPHGALGKRINDGKPHRVTVVKHINSMSFTLAGNTDYLNNMPGFALVPEVLPANISANATPSHDMTTSGYVGFYINQVNAVISNVKVTNNTTGQSKTFFSDNIEGWQARYSGAGEAPHYPTDSNYAGILSQVNGTGPLHVSPNPNIQAFLALNGESSSPEVKAFFGKNSMTNYTVEYDAQINSLSQLHWSVIAANDTNFNIESIQIGHNAPWTWLSVEFPAGGRGGFDLTPGLARPIQTGDWQHMKIIKTGDNLHYESDVPDVVNGETWAPGGGLGQEGLAYTIPADVSANATPSSDLRTSGYVGFYINNVDGIIANVKVTNNTTGESMTFFAADPADYIPDVTSVTYAVDGAAKTITGIVPNTSPDFFASKLNIKKGEFLSCSNLANGRLATGSVANVKAFFNQPVSQYTVIVKGDTTGSGAINAQDLTNVKKMLLNLEVFTGEQMLAADYDSVGGVELTDLVNMKKALVDNSGTGDMGQGITYYISASEGNDNNDGWTASTAFKTAAPLNALTLYPGDNVLLKRGDVFTDMHLKPVGSGNPTGNQWITIDAYGTGANPLLQNGGTVLPAISLSSGQTMQGYRIRNIDVNNYQLGIVSRKAGLNAPFRDLVIDGCSFTNITDGTPFNGVNGQKPEGADLAWAFFLEFIDGAEISNITIDRTDSPCKVVGSNVTIDNLYSNEALTQGMMLYSFPDYTVINNSNPPPVVDGNIVVQNSVITNVGDLGFWLGSCGIILCNTRDSVIKDTEISYVKNSGYAHDGCALDWETYNINCTIENVYAHDNDGAFLLSMEHNDSTQNTVGMSTGNRIINSVSINNGKRDAYGETSFFNVFSHLKGAGQKIEVINCYDVGIQDSMPVLGESNALLNMNHANSRLNVDGNTVSTTADVYQMFGDVNEFVAAFNTHAYTSIADGHLGMGNTAAPRTNYTGTGYTVNTHLKGYVDLVFYSPDTQNGYVWNFNAAGAITANKNVNGTLVPLKSISVPGFNSLNWFRVRIESDASNIYTYIDEKLVDVLEDTTYRTGNAGFVSNHSAWADTFMIYSRTNKTRNALSKPSYSSTMAIFTTGTDFQAITNNNWSTSNVSYTAIPHSKTQVKLTGAEGYIQRTYTSLNSINLNSRSYLNLGLINYSNCNTIVVEWYKSNTWYSATVNIDSMGTDAAPFNTTVTAHKFYHINMAQLSSNWSGSITQVKLKFPAGSNGNVIFSAISISA